MPDRRRVSAAYKDFCDEIGRLCRLDDQNNERYFAGRGFAATARLNSSQMHMLTEAILSRAFSTYELFLEEVFLLYMRGARTRSGRRVKSVVKPRNVDHARAVLKSGMHFVEWNSPDKVIPRCDVYLADNNPMRLAVSTHRSRLENVRKVRNAIAHPSVEAARAYRSVLINELGTAPLTSTPPGAFLLMRDSGVQLPQSFLRAYMRTLTTVADLATA